MPSFQRAFRSPSGLLRCAAYNVGLYSNLKCAGQTPENGDSEGFQRAIADFVCFMPPCRSAERNLFVGKRACRMEQASQVPTSRGLSDRPLDSFGALPIKLNCKVTIKCSSKGVHCKGVKGRPQTSSVYAPLLSLNTAVPVAACNREGHLPALHGAEHLLHLGRGFIRKIYHTGIA